MFIGSLIRMHCSKVLSAVAIAAIAVACGGGGSSVPATPGGSAQPASGATTAAPGGLYVGYYQEDPTNNPEDPVPGAIYLNLPEGNNTFSGNMFFTYVGCQSSNVGTVSGDKLDLDLSGKWTGTVDNTAQEGGYVGKFSTSLNIYQGSYTVKNGKQRIDIPNCIKYDIAAFGTWQLFALEQTYSSTGSGSATGLIGVVVDNGNRIQWSPPDSTQASFVSVMDAALAAANANAIVWQSYYYDGTRAATVPAGLLTAGREYIALAAGLTASGERTYFSSKRFTAQ
jgi:hypothetical protein